MAQHEPTRSFSSPPLISMLKIWCFQSQKTIKKFSKLITLHITMAMTTTTSHMPRPSFYIYQGIRFSQKPSWFRPQPRTKLNPSVNIKASAGVPKEDIVIVGAGIAGLTTAVSLRRSAKKEIEIFAI